MIPLLPREVVRSIVYHTLSPPPLPRSSVEPVFLPLRTPQETRNLASLVLAFGKQHSPWINEILWRQMTLHSGKMVNRLIQILQLADSTKNARVVKVLHLEFKEHPLLDGDETKITNESRGVSPFQIKKLASLLYNVETLCLRATPSGGWFFNAETCLALRRFVNRDVFRTLEVDSEYLSYPSLFQLFSVSPQLETLKLQHINSGWHRTPFQLPSASSDANSTPPFTAGPPQPPPFVRHLRTLVLSQCSLATTHLSTLLNSIHLQNPPVLMHLTFDELFPIGEVQPFFDALSLVLPDLISLHLDVLDTRYNLEAVANGLPFDTVFHHCSDRLTNLVIPAHSLFSDSKDHDYFLIHLNSWSHAAPLRLTVIVNPEWSRAGEIFRELSRIVDDHWLQELAILEVVEVEKDNVAGLEELEKRIEIINKVRKEDEDGEGPLQLEIEYARE